METRELLYETALRGVRPILRVAAPFHAKIGRGLSGRRTAVAALESWAAAEREPDRPLVWVHAPSVGEGLMAQAIIGALRERRPELQVAFTYFSPSAERLAPRVGADVYGYLPWDVRAETDRALAALRPGVVAFVRTEVWPVLAGRAAAAGIRLALVNAVLAERSSRLGRGSRFLLAPAYGRLDAVGAVATPDAGRFPRLGVPAARVRVTGDARFDQVWARVAGTGAGAAAARVPLLRRLHDPAVPTLVAGSTWPADEARLVPAFASVRESSPVRLVIAPHEPDEAHLAGLERRLDDARLRHARLARVEAGDGPLPDVVVIDRVGVLADVYAIADVAYVGGGFHAAGLHSVVEPAALGVPVLFGPRHGNAREAGELAWLGGGSEVSDAGAIRRLLSTLVHDADARTTAGTVARDYVRSRLGGAVANAELLLDLLS